jgi:hypothetical protein
MFKLSALIALALLLTTNSALAQTPLIDRELFFGDP